MKIDFIWGWAIGAAKNMALYKDFIKTGFKKVARYTRIPSKPEYLVAGIRERLHGYLIALLHNGNHPRATREMAHFYRLFN